MSNFESFSEDLVPRNAPHPSAVLDSNLAVPIVPEVSFLVNEPYTRRAPNNTPTPLTYSHWQQMRTKPALHDSIPGRVQKSSNLLASDVDTTERKVMSQSPPICHQLALSVYDPPNNYMPKPMDINHNYRCNTNKTNMLAPEPVHSALNEHKNKVVCDDEVHVVDNLNYNENGSNMHMQSNSKTIAQPIIYPKPEPIVHSVAPPTVNTIVQQNVYPTALTTEPSPMHLLDDIHKLLQQWQHRFGSNYSDVQTQFTTINKKLDMLIGQNSSNAENKETASAAPEKLCQKINTRSVGVMTESCIIHDDATNDFPIFNLNKITTKSDKKDCDNLNSVQVNDDFGTSGICTFFGNIMDEVNDVLHNSPKITAPKAIADLIDSSVVNQSIDDLTFRRRRDTVDTMSNDPSHVDRSMAMKTLAKKYLPNFRTDGDPNVTIYDPDTAAACTINNSGTPAMATRPNDISKNSLEYLTKYPILKGLKGVEDVHTSKGSRH